MESTTYALPATPKQIAYARTGPSQPDTFAMGGSARSAVPERLDRRTSQAHTRDSAGQPALVQTDRLCRAPRPHQAPRRAGRVFPRQGADVEVDRREQVIGVSWWMASRRTNPPRLPSAYEMLPLALLSVRVRIQHLKERQMVTWLQVRDVRAVVVCLFHCFGPPKAHAL